MKETAWLLYMYLQSDLFTVRRRLRHLVEGNGVGSLPWLKNRDPQQKGDQQKLVGGSEVPVCLEGRLVRRVMEEGWSSEPIQDPGSAREILDLDPEHSWADHSVPVVLRGESPEAPLPPMLPAAAEGRGLQGHSSLERMAGSSLWDKAVRTLSNFS